MQRFVLASCFTCVFLLSGCQLFQHESEGPKEEEVVTQDVHNTGEPSAEEHDK